MLREITKTKIMSKKPEICLDSLRWVLNYKAYPSECLDIDGHGGLSFLWTRVQARKLDELGFHKWIQTKEAKVGFDGWLDKKVKLK